MQGLAVPLCVCETEMLGVSSRTRSLSGADYVMAKWSRKGEGGQNNTLRERRPCMAFPLSKSFLPVNSSLAVFSGLIWSFLIREALQ